MGTAIKHPVPDRVKPSFVIFDIRALWRSGDFPGGPAACRSARLAVQLLLCSRNSTFTAIRYYSLLSVNQLTNELTYFIQNVTRIKQRVGYRGRTS